jgi:antitoxin component YwqK of YwqJK toxin-antitoxin module
MTRIDVDDPQLETELDSRVTYRGEFFTGEVAETSGGVLVALTTYRDGFEDGPSQEWFADGTPLSDGTVRRGFPVGPWRLWHSNGVLAEEKVFDDEGKGDILRLRRWSESGELVKDATYPPGS